MLTCSKESGAKWAAMTVQQKSKYQKLADEDKIRHDNQMAERNEKGYFMMPD